MKLTGSKSFLLGIALIMSFVGALGAGVMLGTGLNWWLFAVFCSNGGSRAGMGFKEIETGAGCRHYHKIQISQGCRLLPKGATEDYTCKR